MFYLEDRLSFVCVHASETPQDACTHELKYFFAVHSLASRAAHPPVSDHFVWKLESGRRLCAQSIYTIAVQTQLNINICLIVKMKCWQSLRVNPRALVELPSSEQWPPWDHVYNGVWVAVYWKNSGKRGYRGGVDVMHNLWLLDVVDWQCEVGGEGAGRGHWNERRREGRGALKWEGGWGGRGGH